MSYTDLHCHLLWGIDDGAKTPEESLAMARALVELGFGAVAPSPHARPEYPDVAAVNARREEVRQLLEREGVPLSLHEGAENIFDEAFIASAPTSARRGIAGTQYILVEAPYSGTIPAFAELCFRLKLRGVIPVIAHPERCAQFEVKGEAAEAARVGAALQLDIGALIGRYGKPARRLALDFLEKGLYAIGATDLHSPVGALDWVARSLAELKRVAGAERLRTLMDLHPNRILAGQDLELEPP